MATLGIKSFDCGDLRSSDRTDRGDAGADGAPVEVHGARTAHSDPASELRALKAHYVTNHPEKRGLAGHVDQCRPTVNLERNRHAHLTVNSPASSATAGRS